MLGWQREVHIHLLKKNMLRFYLSFASSALTAMNTTTIAKTVLFLRIHIRWKEGVREKKRNGKLGWCRSRYI